MREQLGATLKEIASLPKKLAQRLERPFDPSRRRFLVTAGVVTGVAAVGAEAKHLYDEWEYEGRREKAVRNHLDKANAAMNRFINDTDGQLDSTLWQRVITKQAQRLPSSSTVQGYVTRFNGDIVRKVIQHNSTSDGSFGSIAAMFGGGFRMPIYYYAPSNMADKFVKDYDTTMATKEPIQVSGARIDYAGRLPVSGKKDRFVATVNAGQAKSLLIYNYNESLKQPELMDAARVDDRGNVTFWERENTAAWQRLSDSSVVKKSASGVNSRPGAITTYLVAQVYDRVYGMVAGSDLSHPDKLLKDMPPGVIPPGVLGR